MERLTYRLNDQCDNPTDSIILKPYLRYEDPETRKKILNRLAAYEDTGLEPEEIKELRELCTDEVAELARTLYKAMESGKLDHLRDILQADQDGRIPPCQRGDVVYCIRHNPCIGYYVKTLTVCTVTIWGPGRFSVFTTKEDELGKTAFLTREEAEAALKGGEG